MENPLELCADLKAIFRRQSGGWLDHYTLNRARSLCEAAEQASPDEHWRVELGRVARYAAHLHTHRDARTDLLREQILITLEALEHRFYNIQ